MPSAGFIPATGLVLFNQKCLHFCWCNRVIPRKLGVGGEGGNGIQYTLTVPSGIQSFSVITTLSWLAAP